MAKRAASELAASELSDEVRLGERRDSLSSSAGPDARSHQTRFQASEPLFQSRPSTSCDGSDCALCHSYTTQQAWPRGGAAPLVSNGQMDPRQTRSQEQREQQLAWQARAQPVPAIMLEAAAFQPSETCQSQQRRQHSDIVCGVEFSREGSLIATAGVAKQVRIYSLSSLQSSSGGSLHQLPVALHRMPSKLSSITWSPDIEGVVTVGDYDGVVSQVHVASGHLLADADEHSGRRIWGVAHSAMRPFLCMSASDDGTARLWSGYGLVQRAGTITPPGGAPICCAEFCRADENLLALASSDRNAYIYDLRNLQEPLVTLESHERPVAFVRFINRHNVVTSSVDATLAWWDICAAPSSPQQAPAGSADEQPGAPQPCLPRQLPSRWYRGHQNSKNFVGLSVREDGLMACGSETHDVFAYHTCWSNPLATRALGAPQHFAPSVADGQPGAQPTSRPCGEFVSAVNWRSMGAVDLGTGPLLAAALSNGVVKVLSLETIGQDAPPVAFSDSV
ncbi:hypothetical protein WJX72_005987 [[Myrmecia] bisecta]|uniref:Uncharacterized protein n=1 Tax=[Myrmecia] bisecta TaxID=41462 RepID=A0AAW1PAV8_9CHLO